MTLAVQLVLYRGSSYLPSLLDSLQSQSDCNWTLFVRDQSEDIAERAHTHQYLEMSGLPYVWDETFDNRGFSGGHQRLFTRHDADLVLLLNQDAILGVEYIHALREAFVDQSVGAAAGVIFKAQYKDGRFYALDEIDSQGLVCRRTHKVEDLKNVEHKFDSTPLEVFGVSGCLPMYRRQAVEATSVDGTLFDARYFMYKEDVDLAYRLKGGGWRALTVPRAIAWHQRTFSMRQRFAQTDRARFESYRNHLWNLVSHGASRSVRGDLWVVIPYEMIKALFVMLTAPRLWWRAIKETHDMLPELKKKRIFYERTHA